MFLLGCFQQRHRWKMRMGIVAWFSEHHYLNKWVERLISISIRPCIDYYLAEITSLGFGRRDPPS
jgi:hypothetical protein